jgi:hypothetical protein
MLIPIMDTGKFQLMEGRIDIIHEHIILVFVTCSMQRILCEAPNHKNSPEENEENGD